MTVTASDDADALTDPVVTLTHRASGGDYGAVTGDLRVTITDNEHARSGHLPGRLHGGRGQRGRSELHRGPDHPALGGGDGNDQRTGKQRLGRGPVQPDL